MQWNNTTIHLDSTKVVSDLQHVDCSGSAGSPTWSMRLTVCLVQAKGSRMVTVSWMQIVQQTVDQYNKIHRHREEVDEQLWRRGESDLFLVLCVFWNIF